MSTLFSLLRSVTLTALIASSMVLLTNSANATVMSATQFYISNAEQLKTEAERISQQTQKALQLHQQLLDNTISTREAFHSYLYQLTRNEQQVEDSLNAARFRMGIPLKSGMEPDYYPAISLSMSLNEPARTRSATLRDLVKQEKRRYEELLQDNEQAFTDVADTLQQLQYLRQQIEQSRNGNDAKRSYEHYLRRLSSAKQQYFRALNEFCVAAAHAEYNGLSGRRLIPGSSPFQLYPEDKALSKNQ